MDNGNRQYTLIDHCIAGVDQALSTLFGNPPQSGRPNPGEGLPLPQLTPQQSRHVAGLMRVNHSGEIAAQGLYQGQALAARREDIKHQMQQSAIEENDHLAWCQQRLQELNDHTSYLSPIWYFGSLSIGFIAGLAGDKWSLGFVAETEHQVVNHLRDHLQQLPTEDEKSRRIIEQMAEDEAHHAHVANTAGAADLPDVIKQTMTIVAKIMTQTAYWL